MSIQFEELYADAVNAGNAAVAAFTPIPMIVGQETHLFSGVMDKTKPMELVSDGVCGFAWINIKPGNCAFANWLKKRNLGRSDDYYGGVTVWVREFNQSMQKKEVYAAAFAKVIRGSNVCKSAYSNSRMD